MQRGRTLVVAFLVAIGLAAGTGLAPQATLAKSRPAATRHTPHRADDHGRHGHGRDDHGRHGHGHDDGAGHH